jgi:hypothetical protein
VEINSGKAVVVTEARNIHFHDFRINHREKFDIQAGRNVDIKMD